LGRWTAGWWDDVQAKLEASCVQPTYFVTQFSGGQDDFNGKLKELKSVQSENCTCGARLTDEHVLSIVGDWRGTERFLTLVAGMQDP
jgi:hypothetical protein